MPTAPNDLSSFLDILRAEGELHTIDAEVDPDLEVAEIHRRVIAAGGPALLFRNVRGAKWPLVTNLFGTAKRVDLAFGSKPEKLIADAAGLVEHLPPKPSQIWEKRSLFTSLLKVGTKNRSNGPVLAENHVSPDLLDLPAIKSWPRDGGRFITLPLVYTEHPEMGGHNLGMYRVQLFGGDEVGLHIQIHRGGGFHLSKAEEHGKPLPVNILVGGPPALILGAIAPLPENVPELALVSLMAGRKVEMARNPAGPLPVVGSAEFCLVGEVTPGARRPEGPFGDHYGYYSETHDFPWMKVKSLLARKNAVYPATVVGKPRQEDFFIGDYLQDLLSPLFPIVMPSVRSLWSYGETGYHSLSGAVVQERYKREAMVSGFRILGEGQLSLTKFLLMTDRDVDLRDFKATWTHILERADFATDLFLFANLSMDTLDYAGPRLNEGSKGILMGLGDPIRKLPTEFNGTPSSAVHDVQVFSPGCLVIETASFEEDADAAEHITRDAAFADWPVLVLADNAKRAAKSSFNFLWTTFTRFDPAADIHAAKTELIHSHVSFTPPILIDARSKPGYPEELFCDDDTADLVSRRWSEYFGGAVEMGDSDRAHLD